MKHSARRKLNRESRPTSSSNRHRQLITCRLILSVKITDRKVSICAGTSRSSGGSNLRISVPIFPVTVVLQMPVHSAK